MKLRAVLGRVGTESTSPHPTSAEGGTGMEVVSEPFWEQMCPPRPQVLSSICVNSSSAGLNGLVLLTAGKVPPQRHCAELGGFQMAQKGWLVARLQEGSWGSWKGCPAILSQTSLWRRRKCHQRLTPLILGFPSQAV